MEQELHYKKLENLYLSAPINEFYKPSSKIEEGQSTIVVTILPDFFHAAHAVHGSLYFKMLDDAAFFAVQSLVMDVFIVTVSFNIYLTRPISQGVLNSTGKVVHRGQRLFVAEAELSDETGRQLARGSGTFMASTIPLGPEVGYQ
jgi:uncharacterized protein (TIGR00369 family)